MTTATETTTYRHGELNAVTREAVLETIRECDSIGMHAFLERHGYRPSAKYQLRFRGKSYPSKAILGVSAGLTSQEFFGGAAVVVRHLTRLGFQVREGRRIVTALGLLELARSAKNAGQFPEQFELPELPVEPASYFASGSNRTGEIRGFASVGQDVGVAVPELREPAVQELEMLAGSDIQVFVDSGAFSEVDKKNVLKVVAPITHEEWVKRLGIYQRLGTVLGDQVWVVAPDRVASQEVTLERLTRYAPEIREIAATGARVLVAMQKGVLTQAEFAGKVDAILGDVAWLPAMPCKKAATSSAELGAFLDARPGTKHVHLLGLGPMNDKTPDYLSHVSRAGCSVSLDANWITANVGKGKQTDQGFLFAGVGDKSRRYTFAQNIARKLLAGARTLFAKVRELALILSFGLTSVLGLTDVDLES